MLASLGLGLRESTPAFFTVGVAKASLVAAMFLGWMGLRSYLGLRMPGRIQWFAWVLLFLAMVGVLTAWESVAVRQSVLTLVGVVVGALTLRDSYWDSTNGRAREIHMLRLFIWLEIVTLLVLVAVSWWLPDYDGPDGSNGQVPILMMIFMVDNILSMVVLTGLVTLRLQQQSDLAREDLRQREAESRALIEDLSAGVMVFLPDQTLAMVNSAALRFLGWDAQRAQKSMLALEPALDLLTERGQVMAPQDSPLNRVLVDGQPVVDLVFGVTLADRLEPHWALCNAHPQRDNKGQLCKVVLSFVDITHLREAQEQQKNLLLQLAQSHKMEALGTLAGGVAHDFNNILTAILGNADLAHTDLPAGAPAHESLQQITQAARRGRELVRQILAFSCSRSLSLSPIAVDAIVAETCDLLRPALTAGIELKIATAPTGLQILSDATQLGQVLLNLGTNAIHALEGKSGRIEFETAWLARHDNGLPAEVALVCVRDGVDAVRVTVSDNGCGMSENTQSHMFEPFFTTKAVGRGSGLGLPVVLGIVKACGGVVKVDSALNEGTRFRLYFPLVAPSNASADPADAAPAPVDASPQVLMKSTFATLVPKDHGEKVVEPKVRPGHILYLDDDETLIFLVRRLLERSGHTVSSYTDQREAIEAVRQTPDAFDLLITDFNMPGMSGLDVAKAVRVINPHLSVAVISGFITEDLQVQAQDAGVRAVLFKTDAVEDLCQMVERLMP